MNSAVTTLSGWKFWNTIPMFHNVPGFFVFWDPAGTAPNVVNPTGTTIIDANGLYALFPWLKPKNPKLKTAITASENGGNYNSGVNPQYVADPGPNNSSLIPGIDNTTLLIIAGAILLIYFIS